MQLDIAPIILNSHKLVKLITIPNELLKDSIINLDTFITDTFSSIIAVTLDKAIIKGTGLDEPTGIITALNTANKIAIDNTLEAMIQTLGNISLDYAGDNLRLVVNSKTFYDKLVKYTMRTDLIGGLVPQILEDRYMVLDMEVILSNTLEDNQLLIGELKEYMLCDRAGATIERVMNTGLDTDITHFRVTERYDGKLTNDRAFVLLTLNDTPITGKEV